MTERREKVTETKEKVTERREKVTETKEKTWLSAKSFTASSHSRVRISSLTAVPR